MMRKGLSEESKIAKQQGFIIMPITFLPSQIFLQRVLTFQCQMFELKCMLFDCCFSYLLIWSPEMVP